MLKNIVYGRDSEEVTYELRFFYKKDRGNSGFAFPCDENGNILEMGKDAMVNYETFLRNPEEFRIFNELTKVVRKYREPDYGTCYCGNRIYLGRDQQCSKCGKWYNAFGQELLPPDEWGWDGTPWNDD